MIDAEDRDDAMELVNSIRRNVQVEINDGHIRAEVKFNGGNPALLCPLCRRIVDTGVDHKTVKAKLCPAGHGCGVYDG